MLSCLLNLLFMLIDLLLFFRIRILTTFPILFSSLDLAVYSFFVLFAPTPPLNKHSILFHSSHDDTTFCLSTNAISRPHTFSRYANTTRIPSCFHGITFTFFLFSIYIISLLLLRYDYLHVAFRFFPRSSIAAYVAWCFFCLCCHVRNCNYNWLVVMIVPPRLQIVRTYTLAPI